MKKILGLDLGVGSIGWALVNEADKGGEESSIIKLGVRVNPLTVDETNNFETGKSITTNADRTLKRHMRRNLDRFQDRRNELILLLKSEGWLDDNDILSEQGNHTTFQTYRLRAKAVEEEVSLKDFARILLMINKKRGYKSSRKAKSAEDGQLVDGMAVALELSERDITPGQFVFELLSKGRKIIPDFYLSDLKVEFERIWAKQQIWYPEVLTDELKEKLIGKSKTESGKLFKSLYDIYTADSKLKDRRLQAYQWRVSALDEQLTIEEVAAAICEVNGAINTSNGYLGAISDRSKELYMKKITVGQFLMQQLDENPLGSLKNKPFYRQDYLDEFERIWETQAKFHHELTQELKKHVRDIIIFFQRPLKSQKGLVSICELEGRELNIKDVKRTILVGPKVCPKSSPLFQDFRIWQVLNNLEVKGKARNNSKKAINQSLFDEKEKNTRLLFQEEKELLFGELRYKEKMTKSQILDLLFENPKSLDLNIKEVCGNRTIAKLFKAYATIIADSGNGDFDVDKMKAEDIESTFHVIFQGLGFSTSILNANLDYAAFEHQPIYLLWHLLYSYEGDNTRTGNESLVQKLQQDYGFDTDSAKTLANVTFEPDYGSLSSKALRKIMPFLVCGNQYSVACALAGYRHSKESLNKEEITQKVLKEHLDILPRNSLRNPVVEKILNQMINVINLIVDNYGKPDEIRIEMARELKKNHKQREEISAAISKANTEHERLKELIKKKFNFPTVSRNDVIRYRLYLELAPRGFKTLYSNTYIPEEKVFTKEFDIEHIIPQARLFDDSFSNKTLEVRAINIEKDKSTARDFVYNKYGESGIKEYEQRVEELYKSRNISKAKHDKLLKAAKDIPLDFINRDLSDTQYIARKAKEILNTLVHTVVATSGTITDRLREDWQLVDVMKELNWDKYDALGLTETIEGRDGQVIYHIKDWTKRNDHRHHAMDALTIAFTQHAFIQYLNNLNARFYEDAPNSVKAIEKKYLYRDKNNKLRFLPPFQHFRTEAEHQLENILVSIKTKNKVTTQNINITKKQGGKNRKVQLTPRGQLHLETVYGRCLQYVTKEAKVGASFDKETIATVAIKAERDALQKRLDEFNNDPKKAFAGKNNLVKNPLYMDDAQTQQVPEKVKLVTMKPVYTIRKAISPELKIDKVIDRGIRAILQERLKEFGNDPKRAFSNLDDNPIWLNKEKHISIKRVTITGVSNAIALHDKKDKDGKMILSKESTPMPTDFVGTSNNHHTAIYRDADGHLQDVVVTFFEATERKRQGLSVIDKTYRQSDGWQFLFTMKQNEYFVFPNSKTGFNPKQIDLTNPDNYELISSNLFRVQTMAKSIYGSSVIRSYTFRHHLESTIAQNIKDVTYKEYKTLTFANDIVKVRVNHIGQIVAVGEY